MKRRIIIVSVIISLQVAVLSCKQKGGEPPIKEVRVENQSGYVFKKIYIEDKRGFTHEILTATTGNNLGGVSMLELCVYKDGKTEETN